VACHLACRINDYLAKGNYADARRMRLHPQEAAGIAAGTLWADPEIAS
jgi:hypothetical protein